MIEKRQNDTSYNVVMTACPFCGEEFDNGRQRVEHFPKSPEFGKPDTEEESDYWERLELRRTQTETVGTIYVSVTKPVVSTGEHRIR